MKRSRPRTGKSTKVSILSRNGPLKEKRLRWTSRIFGMRDIERVLVALRGTLHRGHRLYSNE